MDDVLLVEVFDSLKGLYEKFEGLCLCEGVFGVLV